MGRCTADSITLNLLHANRPLGSVAAVGMLLSTFTSISILSVMHSSPSSSTWKGPCFSDKDGNVFDRGVHYTR